MRIAINGWFLGQSGTGSGQYLAGLLRHMLGYSPEHHFLLVAPPGVSKIPVPDLQLEYWPYESRLWKSGLWRSNLGKVLFEQVVFPRVCRHWEADVAHVPYWGSPLWPSVPTLVTVHDLIPLLLPAYRGGSLVRLYTRLVSAAARRAAVVLTDSLSSKRDIEANLGIPPERVSCVYLAANEEFDAEPEPDDPIIRQQYNLPERYVLYLAGHDERKNVAGLVEAFATVAQADDDVALVIGGKLPEQDVAPFYDPRPLIAALGLEAEVILTGWVDEAHAPALYRGATCAVFASLYEGFGLPVLEALACGTPMVCSNTSSLPELLGDAGFAVDPNDMQALAGAILACLVDESLAAELRQRGPEQAAHFSWARTAQETLTVYEKVAGSGES